MNKITYVEKTYNITVNLDPRSFYTSKYYGILNLSDAFVKPYYMPDLDCPNTGQVLDFILEDLGIDMLRPSDQEKYIFCLSDFLHALATTRTALICWQTGSDNFPSGSAYSEKVARKLKKILILHGYLRQHQPQYQRDRLAVVYEVDLDRIDPDLRFVEHGIGPAVTVRDAKEQVRGEKIKGKTLPRSKFVPDIEPLEAQIKRINSVNERHPLVTPTGTMHFSSRRIFNNGSLLSGGRLYGPWQQLKEVERLASTIGGEAVCEIDLKACFLQICNALIGPGNYLGRDPYSVIPFIADAPNEAERHNRRNLYKVLLAAYLSKGGSDTSNFPKGEKKRDEVTGEVRRVSIRDEFRLGRKVRHRDLMNQVFEVYPFLRQKENLNVSLQYMESEIMIAAIDSMIGLGLPAYSVHDCLLVRRSDKHKAVKLLQQSLLDHLGLIPEMDISYLGDDGETISYFPSISEEHKNKINVSTQDEYDWDDGVFIED